MSRSHGEHEGDAPPMSSFFGGWFIAAAAVVGAAYLVYALTWLYG